ncbi:MAG: hypothetical protein DRJ52_08615 [Thermoprotei archaeon]|nr:MAG: hypothetical protein DRJ52_08615 [Thermoprotei archaeon]
MKTTKILKNLWNIGVRELMCPHCKATILKIEEKGNPKLENLLIHGGKIACLKCGKNIPENSTLYKILTALCEEPRK